VRRLYAVVQRLGVTLDAEWIPTAANVWADRLSRTKESTDWSLDPTFFSALDSLYGPHAVGRFPTALQPADGSPALAAPPLPPLATWTRVNNWVNPPFSHIPLVLNLIKHQRVTATVVVPVRRAQAWWRPRCCRRTRCATCRGGRVCTSPARPQRRGSGPTGGYVPSGSYAAGGARRRRLVTGGDGDWSPHLWPRPRRGRCRGDAGQPACRVHP